jgi:hypothetical protein
MEASCHFSDVIELIKLMASDVTFVCISLSYQEIRFRSGLSSISIHILELYGFADYVF